ncbi:unnamed protein product, partial [Rhizoctonia solani]
MPLISLRESLARSKAKWKKRLQIALYDTSSASSTHSGSAPRLESKKNKCTWPVIKSLMQTLESSTEAFGPLKSVISALNGCIDIYENASKGRKEYDELRVKLEGILVDLAEYTGSPTDLTMTNSVKRLCADIEAELSRVERAHARSTGQRLVDAMDSSDEILECYRRIQGHLERLAERPVSKLLNKSHLRLAAECFNGYPEKNQQACHGDTFSRDVTSQ